MKLLETRPGNYFVYDSITSKVVVTVVEPA